MGSFHILMVPLGRVEPINHLSEKDTMIRMREALEMWRTGAWDRLLVSGGAFTAKEIMTIPGSHVMRDWFVANGIPADRIIVEDQSRHTYQNAQFSLECLQSIFSSEDQVEITLVTHWQHAIRFWLTFRSYGVNITCHKLYYPVGPFMFVKECLMIVLAFLDPKGKFIGRIYSHIRQNR